VANEQLEWEHEIARLLDTGNVTGAATATLRQLGPPVLQYLRAVVRDLDDADDAFSRFAEGVWSSLAQFRRECSLSSWAYRIAWHAALRVLQDPYRRRRHLLQTGEVSQLVAEVRSLASIAREEGVGERIARLRRSLAPDEETMLILRFERGLTWQEIARVLVETGTSVDAAALRKRFERLKNRLRAQAVAEGLIDG
jgi:RNA polymerase sigma-70 factor (ECF subfamily)